MCQVLLYNISVKSEINLHEAIILPADIISTFNEDFEVYNPVVSLKFKDEFKTSIIAKIIRYLDTKHGDEYSYQIDSELLRYERDTGNIKILAGIITGVSILIIIITVIGLIGLFMIKTNRLLRDYAVEITIGSTIRQIAFEIMFECVFITMVSGIIASFISIALLKYAVNYDEFKITVNYFIILQSIFLAICAGVISVIPSLCILRKFSPISVIGKN